MRPSTRSTSGWNARWSSCWVRATRTGRFCAGSYGSLRSKAPWCTTPGLPPSASGMESTSSGPRTGISAGFRSSRPEIHCLAEHRWFWLRVAGESVRLDILSLSLNQGQTQYWPAAGCVPSSPNVLLKQQLNLSFCTDLDGVLRSCSVESRGAISESVPFDVRALLLKMVREFDSNSKSQD